MHSSISEQLARQSVVPMESTIPPEKTIAQWRQQRRSSLPRPERRWSVRRLAAASRLVSLQAASCDHLCDSTTRYDHDRRLLTFLLVCPVCGTEKVMETQHYEPRFEPSAASHLGNASAGATVHELPVRRRDRPTRRAA
jgi:hypothetical protein